MFRYVRGTCCSVVLALSAAGTAYALTVELRAGDELKARPDALSAFERAADSWEAIFTDDVSVLIDANLRNFDDPNVIGGTTPTALAEPYNVIRDAMVVDSQSEPDDEVVAFLPTAAQFSAVLPDVDLSFIGIPRFAFEFDGNLAATTANLKALGFDSSEIALAAGTDRDALIEFNSAFSFDFDNSDGVGAGQTDFETVATHEIGHALGFLSIVDQIEQQIITTDVDLFEETIVETPALTLDLFRFIDGESPQTLDEFTLATRNLTPEFFFPVFDFLNDGQELPAVFDDLSDLSPLSLSTGQLLGDSRQASHWKDDTISGRLLGMMNPTLGPELVFDITPNDIRAFDVIGWDFASQSAIPEPSTAWLLLAGILAGFSAYGRVAGRSRR